MTVMLLLIDLVIAMIVILALCVAVTQWLAQRAENNVPVLGRFLDVGAARLHYVERGHGTPVVLIHGLGGNLRNFWRLVNRLARSHRVILLDRPGCGYSTMRKQAQPSLQEQAHLVARFIKKLGLQNVVLAGHSLGGALALAVALEHPQRLRSLVLISALTEVPPAAPPALRSYMVRSRAVQWLLAWTLIAPLGKLFERKSLQAVFSPEPVQDEFPVEGGGMLSLRPKSFVAAAQDAGKVQAELAAMVPRYSSLNLPIVEIFGRQDAVLDASLHGERFAATLPQVQLELVDGGHMLPVTQPEVVAAAIERAASV